MSDWVVERHRGDAATFHAREMPAEVTRTVWWFEVTSPAVVLGSAQADGIVDRTAASARGVDVVRRRSGGGAVWLEPGAVTWVDVLLPSGDPLWEDDIGSSALWLGDVWAAALDDLGVRGVEVHRGEMERDGDAGLVCFAGLAPGEVVVGGRKVVGVSQRRNRAGARFQCAVIHRWEPTVLAELLIPAEGAAERPALAGRIAEVGTGIGDVDSGLVVARLLARLRSDT